MILLTLILSLQSTLQMLRIRASGNALIHVKANAFIPSLTFSPQIVREPYKFKEQLSECFRNKLSMSQQQRLSLFLENYLSDATERKSSDNHGSKVEGTNV